MNLHTEKANENKSQAVANSQSKQQSSDKSPFQPVDNRPEAIAQNGLQEMANNSPQVKQLKAFQEMANNSPEARQTAQLQAMINSGSVLQDNPIQRKWIPGKDESLMQWDQPIDGRMWFYVKDKDLLFYQDKDGESEMKPYLHWLKEGWLGLTDSALERDAKREVLGGVNPREETDEETTIKLINQGREIYGSMGPKQRLNAISDEWRHYNSTVEDEGGTDPVTEAEGTKVCVKSGFKDTYFKRLRSERGGNYLNYFYFPSGTVVASANFRANPEDGERLTNNEVIYHQLIEAADKAKEKPVIKRLIRDHVVNVTLQPIIRKIRQTAGDGDLEFNPGDDMFYILLTTPNVKAGVFIVNDRGHLLGINTITKLVLQKKGSVEIHFG